jgi:HK97 family phage portal protein
LEFSSTDNEFLENRKMQVLEVSRHFGPMPTHLAQLEDATLSNVEHLNRQLLTYVIDPWLNQWTAAITRALIAPEERATVYVEHETASLTSADLKSTAEAIEKFVGGPVMTPNDGRTLLNKTKLPDGDKLYPPRGAAAPKTGEPVA